MPTAYWGDGSWGDGWWGTGPVIDAPDDGPGTPPLLRGSAWERAAHQGGARPIARLTVESGGGDPVELTIDGTQLEVTRTLARGTQWMCSVTVLREANQDTEKRVLTPGAIFRLEHGWDYGGGFKELRPLGVYQLAKIPTRDRREALQLELHDRWAQIAECESLTEIPAVDYVDGYVIADLVHDVDPSIEVLVKASGSAELPEPIEPEVSRADRIIKMSQAAGLYPHFDAEGRFVVDPVPSEKAPVASLSDGVNATLISVQTEAVFSTPYNCVVLARGEGSAPYILHVADPSNPRHRNQPGMGVRPYRADIGGFFPSSRVPAFAAGLLAQLVGGIELRTFVTWGRGDLNPGDWVAAIEAGTYLIPQRSSLSMVEEIRHNPLTVATELVTRSVPRVLTEEG